MNRLLCGLPGSGKSHYAVKLIRDALEQARIVVTNVPLDLEAVDRLRLPGVVVLLSSDDMAGGLFFAKYPGGVFVLDEVRKWLPAGMTQKELPAGFDAMLSEHRHFEDWRGRSSEVVLITQCASQLPRVVRTLIDSSIVFTKLGRVGIKSAYVARVYNGPAVINELKKGDLVSSFRGKYERALFKLYQSHTRANSNRAGVFEEVGDGGAGNVLKGFQFRLVAIAGVLGVLAAGGLWYKIVAHRGEDQPLSAVPVAAPPAQGEARGEVRAPASADRGTGAGGGRGGSLPALSAFWTSSGSCGALDLEGRRVEASCEQLRGLGVRTVAAVGSGRSSGGVFGGRSSVGSEVAKVAGVSKGGL